MPVQEHGTKQNDGYGFKVNGVHVNPLISDIIIMNYKLPIQMIYNLPMALNYKNV